MSTPSPPAVPTDRQRLAFGGGCYWCLEAVFDSLRGVDRVEPGFVASEGEAAAFSEAVIVHFAPAILPLAVLVEIHLLTHRSTVDHSRRAAYRSAVYAFSPDQAEQARRRLEALQAGFGHALITQVLPVVAFRPSKPRFKDYYYRDPWRPFCTTYINPKLRRVRDRFPDHVDARRLAQGSL